MINNIISLLIKILKEIEKDNPHGLIGKGGTILAVYHLQHRDSQDLDFDCLKSKKGVDWDEYFCSIFDKVAKEEKISYKLNKKGSISAKGRYHMNVTFSTHKDLPKTKMEINFIENEPADIVTQHKFKFHSLENLFFQKLKASEDRGEIKDIIDINFALKSKEPILDPKVLKKFEGIEKLIDAAVQRLSELEKNSQEWKDEFQQTELKFKGINEKTFPSLIRKMKLELKKLIQNINQ